MTEFSIEKAPLFFFTKKIVLFEGKKNQKPRGVPIRPEPLTGRGDLLQRLI
jgi:hypothetical protein